jgi:hypothetical protein
MRTLRFELERRNFVFAQFSRATIDLDPIERRYDLEHRQHGKATLTSLKQSVLRKAIDVGYRWKKA